MVRHEHTLAGSFLVLLALSGVVGAQRRAPSAELGLGVRFFVSLLVLLLLSFLIAALAPRYTTETVADLRDDPGLSFVWGLLVGVVGPILLVVIGLTVIGLLVTIPGVIVIATLSIVGTAVMVVWVGDAVLGAGGDENLKAALIGSILLAVPAAIPILGDIVVGVLGFFGLGVVSKRLYHSWRGGGVGGAKPRESAYDRR